MEIKLLISLARKQKDGWCHTHSFQGHSRVLQVTQAPSITSYLLKVPVHLSIVMSVLMHWLLGGCSTSRSLQLKTSMTTVQWFKPIVLATGKTESGGLKPRSLKPAYESQTLSSNGLSHPRKWGLMKFCYLTKKKKKTNKHKTTSKSYILIDFNDYCSSARINIAFIKNHSIQNTYFPPKLVSTCSLWCQTFSSVLCYMAWQRRALTYYSYGHSNRHRTRGQIRGQQELGPFPPAQLTKWIHCCWPR